MGPTFINTIFIRVILSLALLCSLAIGVDADTGRRVALVIGNGAYHNAPKLPNPARDAKAVAAALRGLDFEVIEAVDLDQPDMQARLDEFSGRLEGADTGLFYYAGHGLQVGGENFLVPIDARLQREAQVFYQTTPLETVLRTMEAAVPTRLVLLDACRDNPLAQRLKRTMATSRSQAVGQGLAEVRTAVGTLIAYATGPGDVASDGDGEHSPFTSALLDHIATPGLEVRQVLGRVRDAVLRQTGERQVPWDSSSLRGEFYFKSTLPELEPATVVAAAPFTPGTDLKPTARTAGRFDERELDLSFWESVRESSKSAAFEAYLQHFPSGVFSSLARSRLDDLKLGDGDAQQTQTSTAAQVFAVPPDKAPSTKSVAIASIPEGATAYGEGPNTTGANTADRSKVMDKPSSSDGFGAVDETTPAAGRTMIALSPDELELGLGLTRDDWRALQRNLRARPKRR